MTDVHYFIRYDPLLTLRIPDFAHPEDVTFIRTALLQEIGLRLRSTVKPKEIAHVLQQLQTNTSERLFSTRDINTTIADVHHEFILEYTTEMCEGFTPLPPELSALHGILNQKHIDHQEVVKAVTNLYAAIEQSI